MRVLAYPRYGPIGASSRYRLLQYVPLFECAGHAVDVGPLLDDAYLRELYASGRRPVGTVVSGYLRRLMQVASPRRFDAVIYEQEAFPYLPIWFEKLARRRASRLFLDYDDAAYVRYERFPVLRDKIARLMFEADGVVVGNPYLASYARQFSKRVEIIPTVVDLARYPVRQKVATDDVVRVAWIGTPVTARLLEPFLPVFERVQREHPEVLFRFVGAGDRIVAGRVRCEAPRWHEENEVELLAECDLGIMPLPDNEFARGKCGLKLIQYMACWMPVVASPVGVNREIVTQGHGGFLASSPAEWEEALRCLIADPELRMRMGRAARERVETEYTLEHGFRKWMVILGGARLGECGSPAIPESEGCSGGVF
jgi:glycosyltransferase involved in cell wall biosynthesis